MTQSPYSHYSPYRTKSAEGEFRHGHGDLYTHLTNLSGNNAINYGVSAAVPGAIAGLGGAGIGALIQALRGKSIGKGALIGGGIGGLAGAGLGLAGGQIYNKDKAVKTLYNEVKSLNKQLNSVKSNPIENLLRQYM